MHVSVLCLACGWSVNLSLDSIYGDGSVIDVYKWNNSLWRKGRVRQKSWFLIDYLRMQSLISFPICVLKRYTAERKKMAPYVCCSIISNTSHPFSTFVTTAHNEFNFLELNCWHKISCRISNVYPYVTVMTGSQNPSAEVREIVTPCLILNLAKDSHRTVARPTYHWIYPSMDVFVSHPSVHSFGSRICLRRQIRR